MIFDTKNTFEANKFHAILLKSNDHQSSTNATGNDSNNHDRYIDYLKSKNLPCFGQISKVSLLSFEQINLDLLGTKLWRLFFTPTAYYKCLILTSRQTIESIQVALTDLIDTRKPMINETDYCKGDLTKLTVYCVGNATAARFNDLIFKIISGFPMIKKFINFDRIEVKQVNSKNVTESAEHKQNGLELSKSIVNDYKSYLNESGTLEEGEKEFKFALYPCSSIRKDDLSNELSKANVLFDELHVYKTTHCQAGLQRLENILNKEINEENRSVCLVFFSPSCVDGIFKLNSLTQMSSLGQTILKNVNGFRFVSIGPSTSSKLKQYVDGVYELSEPSPKALEKVLMKIYESGNGSLIEK